MAEVNQKVNLTKLFNSQFCEFLEDVSIVLPNDTNIKTAKYYINNLVRLNPGLLNKVWYSEVVLPYKTHIDNGNFNFFIEKLFEFESVILSLL